MARAFKCDNCNKLFKEENTDRNVLKPSEGGMIAVCIRVYDSWLRESGTEMELCDKCLNNFVKKWLLVKGS